MRSGHENDAPDLWSMFEDERLLEEAFALLGHLRLLRWFSKTLDTKFRAGIGDQSSADASAHAVAYQDHLFAQWKFLLDGVEFLAKDERAVGIRITAGIAVKPELIVGPDLFVGAQGV